MEDLVSSGSSVVNKMANTHASKIALYRMLSNEKFDHKDILEGSFRMCSSSVSAASHVLCIQDTTEFNYQGIKTKLTPEDPDIGPTSIKAIAGFFCHPMLVTDANSPDIYGLSSTLIYNRSWDQKDKHELDYANLPIEQKESYRWIRSCELSKERMPDPIQITIVGDRESDIYEEFAIVPDRRTNLLVRSRGDRRLSNKAKLWDTMDAYPLEGSTVVAIKSGKKRTARNAQLNISFGKVNILAPISYKGDIKNIELSAILVKENPDSVAEGEDSILWRLLTTHKIETIEDAIQCIEWYKKRWLIEELFRVIKTKGFGIEASQLGSGAALKKLLAMTLQAALRVMQFKLSLSNEALEATVVFSNTEMEFLELVQKKIEGATEKQKNPYSKRSMAWAAWTIARLAGWSGYKSQGPPGYITIKEGWDIFNMQHAGYLIYTQQK